jgi:transcription initiation factor IIE alpha subunit
MNDALQPTLPGTEDEAPGPNPNTGIGGNMGPAYDPIEHQALKTNMDAFVKVSDQWAKVDINSDALASQLGDQINGLRKLLKRIEETRVKNKKPYDDRAKEVQEAYRGIMIPLEKALENLKPKLEKFAADKRQKAEAEKAEKEAQAQRAAEQARTKEMDAQNSGSIMGQVEAENAKKEAEAQAKEAAKPIDTSIKSATGAGRTISERTRRTVEIDNIKHLFMHYKDHDLVRETLLRLAVNEANSATFKDGDKIPGTTIGISKTLA